jgi:hypothetical protein
LSIVGQLSAALLAKPRLTLRLNGLGWDANFSDDWKESSSARPKGSLDSKPTWRKTFWVSCLVGFFVLGHESFSEGRPGVSPMVAPNEFWLQVYRLATAYEAEGLTTTERNEQIVAEFHDMPPIAQREIVAALLRLTVYVRSVYTLVSADVRKTNHRKPQCARALGERVA